MDEDSPEPAREKPSQVPSWITLGFVLGALFVLALPRHGAPDPGPRLMEPEPAAKPPAPAAAPRITTIEAVFAAWERYAVWSGGTTEVALWSPETKSFSEFYEVARLGDNTYFRSITSLTRPVLTHGVDANSPLQFTETERQRFEWLQEVDRENLKAVSAAARDVFPTPPPAKDDGK
jgi:hypothetical protein